MNGARAKFLGVLVALNLFLFSLAAQYYYFSNKDNNIAQQLKDLQNANQLLQNELIAVKSEYDAKHEDWVVLKNKVQQQTSIILLQSQKIEDLESQLALSLKRSSEYRKKYDNQRAETKKAKLAYKQKYQQDIQELEVESNKQLQEKMQALEEEYSDVASLKEKEARVDELMEEFTELRVSLDVMNVCDKNYVERYNQAKGMLNHMRTYLMQNELNKDYYHFVILNDAQITQQAREVCIEPVY